jgi:hypothetical protein
MRVRTLVLAFVLTFASTDGRAEKVKTNQATNIYNRPGEQGKVISKVKEGQMITVLSKDGRWLKVRFQGRTGFVPRSKVDLPETDEVVVRNTRRRPFVDGRGTKRGFNGEGGPEDRVGADATGDVAAAEDKSDVKPTKKDAADDDDKPAKKDDKKKDDKKKPAVADDDDDKPAKKQDKKKDDKKKVVAAAATKKPDKPAVTDDDDDDDTPAKKKPDADKKTAAKTDDDDEPKTSKDDDDKAAEETQPTVHVSSKVDIYEEANPASGVAFTANPSDPLYLSDDVDKATKGKWTFVSSKEGDAGYVMTSSLDLNTDTSPPVGPRTREIMVKARLGVALLSETMASTGGAATGPDNFNSGANAVTLALGGGYTRPYGAKYVIGAEANLDLDKAFSGLPSTDAATMMTNNAAFTLYNFNLRLLGGYDLHGKRGTVFWARLGYHYESFLVSDVTDPAKNVTKTPSEVIKGPTLGLAMTIPNLTQKFGFSLNFDLMFAGGLAQTKNLEDGANPSAGMYGFGFGVTYRWKPPMNFQFNYDYESESLSFGAPVMTSMRTHTGTAATRSDSLNTITFGIVRGF